MAFESIIPGGAPKPDPAPGAPAQSPAAASNLVSEADALKGAEHAKTNVFSVSDLSKGGGQPGTSGGAPIGAGSSVSIGQLVQGKIAVDMMDAIIPAALVLAFYKFGIETKKSQYQLTQGEKNTLAPIMDACLSSINLNFNSPWTTLAVTLAFIYGGKAIEVGGIAAIEGKLARSRPASPVPTKGAGGVKIKTEPEPAPVVPMTQPVSNFAKAPEPFVSDTLGPPIWTDADVDAVVKKQKKSRSKALDWLNYNWRVENGLEIPFRGGRGNKKPQSNF